MDRFVIKKRKAAEIGEDEASGSTSNSENRPLNKIVKENVGKSEKQIFRKFHPEW